MELKDVPGVALTLVLIAAVMVAGFLVIDGLDDNLAQCESGYIYNATKCQLATNVSITSDEENAFLAVGRLNEGMYNIVDYAPQWGTLIGVAILLAIVIGGFMGVAYGRKKGWF
jgi:hypothetical protein